MKNDWGELIRQMLFQMNKIYFEGMKQGIEIYEKPKPRKEERSGDGKSNFNEKVV